MSSLVVLVSLVMTVMDCLRLYPAINVNSHNCLVLIPTPVKCIFLVWTWFLKDLFPLNCSEKIYFLKRTHSCADLFVVVVSVNVLQTVPCFGATFHDKLVGKYISSKAS